ncbi:unnamed protein product [Toxocara canis]|uniref:Uncharacterized protein n=1 Tax=Toxocara canis TaxID=6265 RepID=A0A183V4I7_TOXCA|nr:unnamed protein product [Toxocara canis]
MLLRCYIAPANCCTTSDQYIIRRQGVASLNAAPLKEDQMHRRLLIHRYLPWCFEQAVNGRLLIAFDWENHFAEPLSEVQRLCCIKPLLHKIPSSRFTRALVFVVCVALGGGVLASAASATIAEFGVQLARRLAPSLQEYLVQLPSMEFLSGSPSAPRATSLNELSYNISLSP